MKPMFIRKSVLAVVLTAITAFVVSAAAQEEKPKPQILFTNVNVFDGKSDTLAEGMSVLVEGNLIKKVSEGDIEVGDDATVIDGGGRTLMPGLHDMHTHIGIFRPVAGDNRIDMTPFLVGAVSAARAEGMLMNGFTLIRDIGGPAKFLQRAIDAGVVVGPRVLPTENFVTQTSGHGDFRNRTDPNPNIDVRGSTNYIDEYYSCFADGPTEIRRCVREQLGKGATQIKIFTGGGVASEKDPLHSVQYTPEEVQVAVQTAAQWKTYVSAHAFTDDSIRLAVENGVQVIEHGPLMSEDSAKLMAEKGTWLVPSVAAVLAIDWDNFRKISSPSTYAKGRVLVDGVPKEMEYAVKHGVKMAFGTDLLSDWESSVAYDNDANQEFVWLAKFMPNADALRMATGNAGELHALSGPNTPYKDGPTGVVQEGAYADLLLVDGNPLEDIEIMTEPGKNFRIIMKDGAIYKNTLLADAINLELKQKLLKAAPPHLRLYGDYD
jgi:imidazolonepropionase-like amidohydrolase